jgi:hypothetical protein
MSCRSFLSLALLLTAGAASASDGVPDSGNAYPSVGFYYTAYQDVGAKLATIGGCSGSLIAPTIFLTAAHCTFYDTLRFADGTYARAANWVTFAPVALENDFRCFLHDIRYDGYKDVECVLADRTKPAPTFLKAASTGISHPAYPLIQKDGSMLEPFGPENTDVGVLILERPARGVTPLATAAAGSLDALDTTGVTLVGVGYGLDFHKSLPATPDKPGTDGPTNEEGPYGIRRIAQVGAIQMITPTRITPTQRNSQGEDSVCYWDSGSPLFLARNGVVEKAVVNGVLTGGALWCQGSWDPYQRLDIPSSLEFLSCVRDARDADEACLCGIEGELDLCDEISLR